MGEIILHFKIDAFGRWNAPDRNAVKIYLLAANLHNKQHNERRTKSRLRKKKRKQ